MMHVVHLSVCLTLESDLSMQGFVDSSLQMRTTSQVLAVGCWVSQVQGAHSCSAQGSLREQEGSLETTVHVEKLKVLYGFEALKHKTAKQERIIKTYINIYLNYILLSYSPHSSTSYRCADG